MNKTATMIFLLGINFIIWLNSWLYTGSEWQTKSRQRFDLYFTEMGFILQSVVCLTINFGPSSLGRFSVYLVSMVASCSMFISLTALQLFVVLWKWASSCNGNPEMEKLYQDNKKVYYLYLVASAILVGLAGVLAVVIFSQHVASHRRDYGSLTEALKKFLKICQNEKSASGGILLKTEIEAQGQVTPPYKMLVHHFLENFLCTRKPEESIDSSYICRVCGEPILPTDLRLKSRRYNNVHFSCFSADMFGYRNVRNKLHSNIIDMQPTDYINLLARLDPADEEDSDEEVKDAAGDKNPRDPEEYSFIDEIEQGDV